MVVDSKYKSSDYGGLATPKRSCDVVRLSKEAEVLDFIRKEKVIF
jgi:hypothetical protein